MIYGGIPDLDSKINRCDELNKIINDTSFWNNPDKDKYLKEYNDLNNLVNDISSVKNKIVSNMELLDMDIDNDMLDVINEEYVDIKKNVERLRTETYLSGEYDKSDCFLEIHSGAGGTEACDWANMLFRMYTRYCERHNLKYEILSYLDGEEAGIKSVSMKINGLYAYGNLRGEKGVHRLVRLSPFDANNKRHTSFASIDITPEFNEDIDIKIDDKDLKIDVYRSSGAGGQHVNTTDSAVRITHLPTKIVVTCQNERSQIQNRETAMKILKGKLKLLEIERQQQEMHNIKGDNVNIEFGSQIRSYVMHPYSMVKDHRTNYETSDVTGVLDGNIDKFIEEYLMISN
jgi:peptide chain release factor 2